MGDNCNVVSENHTKSDVQGKLLGAELWKKFHKLQTEMIITKTGRRMFPCLRIELSGLDPNIAYYIYLEFSLINNCRFKYSSGMGWVPAGEEYTAYSQNIYVHPDSPALGSHWMSQPISFSRVKLTNTAVSEAGHVILSSMHKYQPQIHIKPAYEGTPMWSSKILTFPETEFITVTAYQNDAITKLKIDHNPFAKGFRENGLFNCKRKQKLKQENTEELPIKREKCEESFSEVSSSSPSSPASVYEDVSSRISTSSSTNYHPIYPYIHEPYYATYDHRPYFLPHYYYYYYPFHPYYNFQMTPRLIPPTLALPENSTIKEEHRKLTDFSIKAITGL